MSEPQTLLVFGKSGQVAQELARIPVPDYFQLSFAGRDRCNLYTENPAALIAQASPAGVINASAYTAVDRAESEPELAFRLNRDAVGEMASVCAKAEIPFVHISTDYVFDGRKAEPYVETDLRKPLSVYGASKAAGEDAVNAAGGRSTVFRTAWVVSPFGSNFVKTMRRLAVEQDHVSVVADQCGRPTLASDIATMAVKAIQKFLEGGDDLQGVLHLAGADDAVWADVAEFVFELQRSLTGKRPHLKRIAASDYLTAAVRPMNSRLDTSKLQAAANWSPRPWRETVKGCFLL